ncbi:MAG: hypothetical protein IJJ26_09890 [Victivallales bacterium]|nr:hypothetical protein [Victivallales bacterium]
MGAFLYRSDYDGFVVHGWMWKAVHGIDYSWGTGGGVLGGSRPRLWSHEFGAYMGLHIDQWGWATGKTWMPFNCPSDPSHVDGSKGNYVPLSYGLIFTYFKVGRQICMKENWVASPGRAYFICDRDWYGRTSSSSSMNPYYNTLNPKTAADGRQYPGRPVSQSTSPTMIIEWGRTIGLNHNNCSNNLYFDGHVMARGNGQFAQVKNPQMKTAANGTAEIPSSTLSEQNKYLNDNF